MVGWSVGRQTLRKYKTILFYIPFWSLILVDLFGHPDQTRHSDQIKSICENVCPFFLCKMVKQPKNAKLWTRKQKSNYLWNKYVLKFVLLKHTIQYFYSSIQCVLSDFCSTDSFAFNKKTTYSLTFTLQIFTQFYFVLRLNKCHYNISLFGK